MGAVHSMEPNVVPSPESGVIPGLFQDSSEQPQSVLTSPLMSFVRGLQAQLPWGQLGDARSSWALHMDALDL